MNIHRCIFKSAAVFSLTETREIFFLLRININIFTYEEGTALLHC